MKKKVVVIGGGLAGLSASITLLNHGFDVFLFEKNKELGGLCSGYSKNGHYLDACIHWLTGTKENNKFNLLLRGLDCLNDDVKIISLPTLGTFIYKCEKVTLYRDLEKGEKEWIKAYPDDEEKIKLFYATLKSFCSLEDVMDQKEDKPFYWSDKIKKIISLTPQSAEIFNSMRLSRAEYASRFKSEAIKNAITNGQNGFNSMFFFFMEYAMFVNGNADIPEGGAGPMVARAKERFKALGGHLFLNTEVTQIIKHDGKVLGVKAGQEIYLANAVVSCLDPHFTYKELCRGEIRSKRLERMEREENKHKLSSSYNLYLLVKDGLKDVDVPTGLSFEPLKVGVNEYTSLFFRPYTFDEAFKKDGKVVVSLLVDQTLEDFNYYMSLNEEEYQKEIENTNANLLKIVEHYFPHLKGKIEILEFFGPKEIYERTYSKGGAILSYSLNISNLPAGLKFQEKEYKNLFLASQWDSPIGGTPNAVNNGHLAALEVIEYLKD